MRRYRITGQLGTYKDGLRGEKYEEVRVEIVAPSYFIGLLQRLSAFVDGHLKVEDITGNDSSELVVFDK